MLELTLQKQLIIAVIFSFEQTIQTINKHFPEYNDHYLKFIYHFTSTNKCFGQNQYITIILEGMAVNIMDTMNVM